MTNYEKKYNEAILRADEAVQKGCLDKDMFDIIFPPEESEDERKKELKEFIKRPSWKPSEQKEQKQDKWSKKDKKILQSLHHVMNCADAQNVVKRDGLSIEDVCNFLFSIEPSWKPSEEQMEALKEALETYKGFEEYDAMKSLYNDLKKL